MLATLIFGLIGGLADGAPSILADPSPAVRTVTSSRTGPESSFLSPAPPLSWPPQATRRSAPLFTLQAEAQPGLPRGTATEATTPPAPPRRVVCTIRVLTADPHLDPGMARPMERDIDPGMVSSSPCR